MGLSALASLAGVLIARMILSAPVAAKLARRGIDPDEVQQLPANGAQSKPNPRPRVPGSRFLIGPTNGGRMLTVVVEPERADEAIWHVRTAWQASATEQMFYYRRS
jgi:hypothetical protein